MKGHQLCLVGVVPAVTATSGAAQPATAVLSDSASSSSGNSNYSSSGGASANGGGYGSGSSTKHAKLSIKTELLPNTSSTTSTAGKRGTNGTAASEAVDAASELSGLDVRIPDVQIPAQVTNYLCYKVSL
jgi:hypothetical protein